MDDTSAAIAAALDQVGPRLRRLRTQRRITLTGLATTTGISKSTVSRLETGQRRPTLELLLALSQVYRVPVDDLVGAPEVGDPRIRFRPGRLKGRTVIPLTRQMLLVVPPPARASARTPSLSRRGHVGREDDDRVDAGLTARS